MSHALADARPRSRAYRTMKAWILDGRLERGQPLPAEESLARELGVSRGTLRSVLGLLSADGLIAGDKFKRRLVSGPQDPPGMARELLGRSCVVLSAVPGASTSTSADDECMRRDAGLAIGAADMHALHVAIASCTERALDELIASRPRGVLASHQVCESGLGRQALARFQAQDIPIVVHGDGAEAQSFDRVISDSAQGVGDLMRLLASRGHRNVLRVWVDREAYWIRGRDRGYAAACASLGMAPLPPVHVAQLAKRSRTPDAENFEARVRMYAGALLGRLDGPVRVDAILATSDCDVFPIAAACERLGRMTGSDIQVCGFDNYWWECWERAQVPYDPLATVDRDVSGIGRSMVALLLDRIAGRLPPVKQRRVICQSLVPNPARMAVAPGALAGLPA